MSNDAFAVPLNATTEHSTGPKSLLNTLDANWATNIARDYIHATLSHEPPVTIITHLPDQHLSNLTFSHGHSSVCHGADVSYDDIERDKNSLARALL